MQLTDNVSQISELGIERLEQPYPDIKPFTPFPSFDYVSKSYADILDSIATIFGLWFAIAAITRLSHAIYGNSTRTVALRELIDRLITFDISSLFSIRKRNYTPPQVRYLSNVRTRVLSLLFFILVFGAEALAVFSQTSRRLGLDDLKLKRLSFEVPPESSSYNKTVRWGPNLLLDPETTDVRVPLYLFYNSEANISRSMVSVVPSDIEYSEIQFIFSSEDHRYLQVSQSMEGQTFSAFRYSVEVRDELSGTFLLLNVTKCGFNMTQSGLSWLTSKLNEKLPSINATGHHYNRTTSQILTYIGRYDRQNREKLESAVFHLINSMFVLSHETLKSADFISSDAQKLSENDKYKLRKINCGKVKRLSGIILWIIAAFFGMISFAVDSMTWNMEDDINIMIAECLSTSPTDPLRFGENIPFRIVNLDSSDTYDIEKDDQESSNQNTCEAAHRLELERVEVIAQKPL